MLFHHREPVPGRDAQGGDGHAHDEGAQGGDGGGEADGPAGLALGHDHRHLLEGAGVAQAGEEEHRQHRPQEAGELGRIRGVGAEIGRASCRERV